MTEWYVLSMMSASTITCNLSQHFLCCIQNLRHFEIYKFNLTTARATSCLRLQKKMRAAWVKIPFRCVPLCTAMCLCVPLCVYYVGGRTVLPCIVTASLSMACTVWLVCVCVWLLVCVCVCVCQAKWPLSNPWKVCAAPSSCSWPDSKQ